MVQFIDGPAVTPSVMTGTPFASVAGKEIHYDSTAARLAALEQGLLPPDNGVSTSAVEAAISPEMLEAMRSGRPPDPSAMAAVVESTARLNLPSSVTRLRGDPRLLLPLGGGVSVEIAFNGGFPKARHWRRLLRHLEIEADPENGWEEEINEGKETAVAAVRAGDDESRSRLSRSAQRRKRKGDSILSRTGQLAEPLDRDDAGAGENRGA